MLIDLIILLLMILIMFVPSIIAFNRNLKRRWACLIVNVLFGWTIIAWVPLLVWSMLTSAVE